MMWVKLKYFASIMPSMLVKLSSQILEEPANFKYLYLFVYVLGKVFQSLDNIFRMMHVKWGALVIHFDNIIANYPLKQSWQISLMQYLPASKLPDGRCL